MGKERTTTHIRIPKDVKIAMDMEKGKDTYGNFLKKFINLKQEIKK